MMQIEHRQTQTQRQTQQLVLTQKMQQGLHILQLSGLELEQYVQQEIETNPFLEQLQQREAPAEIPAETPAKSTANEGDFGFEESFDLDAYSDKWGIKHREGQDLSRNAELWERRQFYENSITQSESLRSHLLTQMRIATDDDRLYEIGERIIIGDIDDRGYFTGNVSDIAVELEVTEEEVRQTLEIVKRFEPTGVGAADLPECLLLQIEAELPEEEELKILVRNHLDDLVARRIPQIAKAMQLSPERVEMLQELLKTLNPWPGRLFTQEPPQYIIPEVEVEKIDDEYVVRLLEDRSAFLKVNREYQKSLNNGHLSPEDKNYVRQKLESAQWLCQNIAQRQRTILRVAQAIVEVQQDFLDKGVEHIRPLTLQNIADRVGVHESTIARTTRGKYIQTPQGLFELKYFFSPGLSNQTGEDQSSKSVMALVKKIIDEEDPHQPLSDQKIADIIQKDHGTTIARRTVTKYREAMGILKTSMRKRY